MITTITTSTISTVSTVTTIMGAGMTLGLMAVITLATFLCARELVAATERNTRRFLAHSFDTAIAPLLVAFAVIITLKIVEILA